MRALLAAAGLLVLLLAGCKDSPPASPGAPAAAAPQAVALEAIAAEGTGFSAGPSMSARVVYVFFDAQCPHCSALWVAARPLRSQARFVWMPVGLLNDASTAQGAALLDAADPVAAMDQHEASMAAGQGGIAGAGASQAKREAVGRNTAIMNRYSFASVPAIVGKHAQTGETVVIEGSLPTAALAQRLGLQAPS